MQIVAMKRKMKKINFPKPDTAASKANTCLEKLTSVMILFHLLGAFQHNNSLEDKNYPDRQDCRAQAVLG